MGPTSNVSSHIHDGNKSHNLWVEIVGKIKQNKIKIKIKILEAREEKIRVDIGAQRA